MDFLIQIAAETNHYVQKYKTYRGSDEVEYGA
jgi:hypothetical protein